MSIFDLPGPEFLVLYTAYAVTVVAVLYAVLSLGATPSPQSRLLSDPFQIACLRGGLIEPARVALVSLADRGLLEVNRRKMIAPTKNTPPRDLNPIEQAILANCPRPEGAARQVLRNSAVVSACENLRQSLVRLGLVPTPRQHFVRAALCAAAAWLVLTVGIAKLVIAADRGHNNVQILIIGILVLGVVFLCLGMPQKRTRLGARMLVDLRQLLAGRSGRRSVGADTSEALLLAGTFGLPGLVGYSELQAAYAAGRPANASSSCGGSSCSSGDGGGGSGCGGCGSSS